MPDQKTEKTVVKKEKPVSTTPIEEDPKGKITPEIIAAIEPIPEFKAPEHPPIRPEMDPRLSIGNRILAYLESRKSSEFIRINDFLKSLYPLPKPGHSPGYENVQNMRFLRMTLRQLQEDGKVEFANNAFDRLGKHYYEGSAPETKCHNVLTVPIEAKILQ